MKEYKTSCKHCGNSWISHNLKFGTCPNTSNPNQKYESEFEVK